MITYGRLSRALHRQRKHIASNTSPYSGSCRKCDRDAEELYSASVREPDHVPVVHKIRQAVNGMREAYPDADRAKVLEHLAYLEALTAIRDGTADPAAVAYEALQATKVDYHEWDAGVRNGVVYDAGYAASLSKPAAANYADDTDPAQPIQCSRDGDRHRQKSPC